MSKDKPLLDKAYDRKDKDEVTALYREWATTYDDELKDNSYVAPQVGAGVFAEHVRDLDARILDLGCGTGLVGQALATHGYTSIDGLDLSADAPDMHSESNRVNETDSTGPDRLMGHGQG